MISDNYKSGRIVDSVEKLAARVNVTTNETLVVVTETVSVAVYKPPKNTVSTLNDITGYFIELGKRKSSNNEGLALVTSLKFIRQIFQYLSK